MNILNTIKKFFRGTKAETVEDIDTLLSLLEQAKQKKNPVRMANYYLKLGQAYKNAGQASKSLYYLKRFDNLVSGENSLYGQFAEDDDMVMGLIAELEIDSEPYEIEMQTLVLEKSEELNLLQKMQWTLLTMSRFCALFKRICVLPGFERIGKLDEMITYFCDGLYGETDEDRKSKLKKYAVQMEEVFDSALMYDYTKKVEIPGRERFVPADLEGGEVGTYYISMAYDALVTFISDELDEELVEMEIAACGLLTDYYYRTSESDSDVRGEKKIQEETERILSDYAFVKEEPDREKFRARVEGYKKVMLV